MKFGKTHCYRKTVILSFGLKSEIEQEQLNLTHFFEISIPFDVLNQKLSASETKIVIGTYLFNFTKNGSTRKKKC